MMMAHDALAYAALTLALVASWASPAYYLSSIVASAFMLLPHAPHNTKATVQMWHRDRPAFWANVEQGVGGGTTPWILDVVRAACEDESEHFSIYKKKIGDDGSQLLAAALSKMPRPLPFKTIDVRLNLLTEKGATALAGAIQAGFVGGQLEGLYLGDNEKVGDAGVKALMSALPPTTSVLHLGAAGCGDDGAASVASTLPALPALTQLLLHENFIGASGAKALADELIAQKGSQLEKLWIYRNALLDEGADMLARALPYMKGSLQEFLAYSNGLSDSAKKALAEAAKHGANVPDIKV